MSGVFERTHPAMRQRCAWCQATPGNWCYKIIRRRPTPVLGFFHPSRVESLGLPYRPVVPDDAYSQERPRTVPGAE